MKCGGFRRAKKCTRRAGGVKRIVGFRGEYSPKNRAPRVDGRDSYYPGNNPASTECRIARDAV